MYDEMYVSIKNFDFDFESILGKCIRLLIDIQYVRAHWSNINRKIMQLVLTYNAKYSQIKTK